MSNKIIRYKEGQWFAIPLRTSGYGLGIIVRGNSKSKGGLGYFFGPKFLTIPTAKDTLKRNYTDAVLICIFGDLGIMRGDWPLIEEGQQFYREQWPVPLFHRIPPIPSGKAYIVEYSQDSNDMLKPQREKLLPVTPDILNLPVDGSFGSTAVEITLTRILD